MTEPRRLEPQDIENITGITGEHPVRQRNRLRKWGIRAEVNAKREVVCFWSWVAAAGLPTSAGPQYLQEPSANDDDDIGMNLGALDGSR